MMKKCPFCSEEIQDEAIKCRYCGSMLNGEPPPSAQPQPPVAIVNAAPTFPKGTVLLLVSAGLFWLACSRIHSLVSLIGTASRGDFGKEVKFFNDALKYHKDFHGHLFGADIGSVNPLTSLIIYLAAVICLNIAIGFYRRENRRRESYVWAVIGFLVLMTVLYFNAPVLVFNGIICFAVVLLAFVNSISNTTKLKPRTTLLIIICVLFFPFLWPILIIMLIIAVFRFIMKRKAKANGQIPANGGDPRPEAENPPTHCGGRYLDADAPRRWNPAPDLGNENKQEPPRE